MINQIPNQGAGAHPEVLENAMPRLTDTSPEAEQVLIECYRRMPIEQRWRNLVSDYRLARLLHAAGVRRRIPTASERDITADWLRAGLDEFPSIGRQELRMESNTDNFQPGLFHVIAVFDALGIPYAIGGSIASSIHGIGRMTRDADVTAEPFPGREAEFVARFDPSEYYIRLPAVREAIRDRSSFNVLHPPSGFKIDVFVRSDEPFERAAFARKVWERLPDESLPPLAFHSAEDIILFKLRWYRLGGEVSDRQWGDVLGVLKVQADRLDDDYLDHWATELGVADLLNRARSEATGSPISGDH